MHRKLLLIIFIFSLTYTNCYSQKRDQFLKRGVVKTKNYLVEIPFHYVNKHIFIDIWIGNKKYNFLFDTAYELSVIDNSIANEINYNFKKEIEISGSSISADKVKLVELPSIIISTIGFENTYGIIQDLFFIKRNYDSLKVGGIIGNNLMRKANWQIDYKNSVIKISDSIGNFNIPQTANVIEMSKTKLGNSYIALFIDTRKYKFIFDLGSGGRFTADSSFIQFLDTENIDLTKPVPKKREVIVQKITLGDIELNNQTVSIEKGVSSLIGNAFFQDYLLTIDWNKNLLYLSPQTGLKTSMKN